MHPAPWEKSAALYESSPARSTMPPKPIIPHPWLTGEVLA